MVPAGKLSPEGEVSKAYGVAMVAALNEAGRIITARCRKTIQKLISILDRQDLAAAITRMDNGHGCGL
jgi:hypothetical protein